VWSFREAALGLSMAMKGDAKSLSFVEDTAVAPERLRDYIAAFLKIVEDHGTRAGVYAHASVGCLHVRPVVNLKTADGVRTFKSIAGAIADLVLAYGGALSGEHGDGLVRGPFIEKMFGPVLYGAFRDVKRAFDPDGVLNPGKIVDAPPLTANLRYGAGYATPDPATYFDYSDHGGLGRAVEMCSGLGACRKRGEGTMCPSYMATLEETHSTRGRANTLRLAMAGRLGDARLTSNDVYQVMDLCLECRACKAECPVGVDVGRFKSEFLAEYWTENGTPLGVRAMAHVRSLLAVGSLAPALTNAIARSGLTRRVAERVLGVDRRRTLPSLAPRTFERTFETIAGPRSSGADVVLFNDTFTNFCHPQVGAAAVEVLRAAGCEPRLAPHGCCGRPLMSKGLLGEARELAARNVGALADAAAARRPIVFLEPSCLSAVREDAPALLRGELQARAREIADVCVLLEDFLESRAGIAPLPLAKGPASILLHGHCHQKAMGLVAPARALLARIPGATVRELDAGCCGMAGSFGYAREHYGISQTIGERRLLPAARSMAPDTVLIASGTSCREQVRHFTGAAAMHPAELLRSLLVNR
jgi:Fe-S oxidoreductase